VTRSACLLQLDRKLCVGVSRGSFRDAACDANGTSPQIQNQPEVLTRRKIVGDGVDAQYKAVSLLPDSELMEVLHAASSGIKSLFLEL
jgi:hypothetical protein